MDNMDTRQQISNLCDMIAQALEGNYDATGLADGLDEDFAPLVQRIRRIIDAYKHCNFEMQAAASQILSATEDLSLTLEESTAFSHELYSRSHSVCGINAQSHSNTLLAAQQIKDFIGRIDSIRQASDKAKATNAQAKAAIDSGLERVRQTMGFIGRMESMTSDTVAYVRAFIASTSHITKIARIVENLSKQMELIAFNALVESRRAGVEGRGFGVVASAFRDLADQSKRKVKDIFEVISTIHTESKQLEETVARNASGVKECAAHAGSIAAELGAIEASYREVSDVVNVIYSDVDAQSSAAQRISQSVYDIESNSEKMSEDFDGIHSAIKNQNAKMDDLSRLGRYLKDASQSLTVFAERAGTQEKARDTQRIAQAAEEVFAMLRDAVLSNASFYSMQPEIHRCLLDRLMRAGAIESVWSNHANGKFVYSNPPAGIANARIRPWFKESAAGKKYVSDVYISAITHQPCVTVSVPVVRDGECIGVLGADLKLAAG
jgi:Methyl-accepting chemotaxis protein